MNRWKVQSLVSEVAALGQELSTHLQDHDNGRFACDLNIVFLQDMV
jgi:hypothetical protein